MANLSVSRAERLDMRVVSMIPEITRGFANTLISTGKVSVNGLVVNKPGYKLKRGDKINIDFDKNQLNIIPDIDIPIIYEDDDCVVVDKPTGILTHSKGNFNPEASVASWLGRHMTGLGIKSFKELEKDVAIGSPNNPRAGIVHRLDRATSGVMICAKTPASLAWLQKQFSKRNVKKTYYAVIEGELKPSEAIIEMPIERNPKSPQRFRVGQNGKSAETYYRVVLSGTKYSLVELKPKTGRTHQLRVHLMHQGHPIVGDSFYDGISADRLYLHASMLEITIPCGERKIFESALPKAFEDLVNE